MKELPPEYAAMHRWQWGEFILLEPATVLTNLAITLVCLYAYFKLRKLELTKPQKLAIHFFWLMALATIIGGVLGHGFLYLTGKQGKIPGWFLSMIAVALFERAVIAQARNYMPPKVGAFFSVLNYVEIASLALAALLTLNFHFVEIHAAYGLLIVVFGFTWYTFYKTGAAYARHIFSATVVGALAALCHGLKLSISTWFNYNDVSHIFMLVAIYLYYLGVRSMSVSGEHLHEPK